MEIVMFEPELNLKKEGEFTILTAVTLTPTTCFRGEEVRTGVPSQGRIDRSTQGVMLTLVSEGDICYDSPTLVTQQIKFKLGGGISKIKVYVMLSGVIVGTRTIQIYEDHPIMRAEGGGDMPVPFFYLQ